jgi:large subunit ribosomal protein L15
MRLNTLKPAAGSKRKRLRVGRGASAGQGKTSGRGVKGQRARKGGYHKVGFEGGQMPLQRRMPKVGFRSAIKRTRAEVRLDELNKITGEVIDIAALKAANVIPVFAEQAKVVLSGKITRKFQLKGVLATKGARTAIEAAGGSVEVVEVPSIEGSKKAPKVAKLTAKTDKKPGGKPAKGAKA